MKVVATRCALASALAVLTFVTGCGGAGSDPSDHDDAQASVDTGTPHPVRRGLDAVDESRALTSMINARQAEAMDQLD